MKGIWFILISISFNVLGQLSMKYAMIKYGEVNLQLSKILTIVFSIFTRPFVILGLLLYFVSAFFWITALSKVELSYAYPMLSIGYVLIFFLSWLLFAEQATLIKFIGTVVVGLGLFLIARG